MSADLIDAARRVRLNAHAPYSRFKVGAALRSAGGRIFLGANVENASYPEGICAETAAIAQMVAAGETRIVEIAIVAEEAIPPCGGCRQRLHEFAGPECAVHMAGASEGESLTLTLGQLLPGAFVFRAS